MQARPSEHHDRQAPPSAFKWSAGGWFGSLIGGTAWMLSGLLIGPRPMTIRVTLTCWGAPNIVGLLLWRRRERIAPYAAMQYLLATIALFAVLYFLGLNALGRQPVLDARFGERQYWLLLLFPALMAWFYFQERAAKNRQKSVDDR